MSMCVVYVGHPRLQPLKSRFSESFRAPWRSDGLASSVSGASACTNGSQGRTTRTQGSLGAEAAPPLGWLRCDHA
eukprot:4446561-Alexandrium_andersonii.AAC.1